MRMFGLQPGLAARMHGKRCLGAAGGVNALAASKEYVASVHHECLTREEGGGV